MKNNKKLKIFISYSHLDEDDINEFRKHTSPLDDLIDSWYDRQILAGQNLQNTIDSNLGNADIICLFISANFLDSSACRQEKITALKLKETKGISVVPIILSKCAWLDDNKLSSLLALPTDGKAVEDYDKSNHAWHTVYEKLKLVINEGLQIKKLEFTEQFSEFLKSAEMLTKAHSKKERVILDDVFVYPELEKYDDVREYEKKETAENLIEDFCKYSKVLIAGENQSGKTTLCKQIILRLRENNFIPVYLSDKNKQYQGKIENKISTAFDEQYKGISFEKIEKERIVPILDDFHFAKHKERHIQDLSVYHHRVIIVDDIFSLNLRDENLIRSFSHFKIKEFSPSLRNRLIEKWTHLTDKIEGAVKHNENEAYQRIDHTTELVNASLGKIIGSGIMPAYPFFILSVISTNEAFGKSLDQEITSQGHCYQALIYLYLTKEGVKNEEIDTYINFLTEFAFFFYKEEKSTLSNEGLREFMRLYLKKYNLPIKEKILLNKLYRTQIIVQDSCNNYSFCYPYLYYFFVAKYLSEHIDDNKKVIDSIIENLHKDENAYIAIFISHHSRSAYILDEITLNAYSLFENHNASNLTKDEVSFIDKKLDVIVKEALPLTTSTPEKERAARLENQDKAEHIDKQNKENSFQEEDDDLAIEIRRSIKTVEVMGRIIKNRAGSLEKERLESIFEEAMNVHLRILSSFFEAIENEEEEFVAYISNRVNKIIEDKADQRRIAGRVVSKPSIGELEKLSKIIFWNMNFFFIYGLINKIIHSIGSNKLTEVVKKVCDRENTPASFLIKHGILMWYNKNLQLDNIVSKVEKDEFSETAKKIIKFMIVNHCTMHTVDFKQKQKIQNKLKIPSQKLLKQSK